MDNSGEKLYEIVMNDIPKNPVNIAGNILVCNRGCNLRWTLGEIDSFTLVRNKRHLLLKNLMYKQKPISLAPNKHVVTFNGGANGYADKNYVLSTIAFNFPSIVYHGGAAASGDILLICKANDNTNLTLVLIIPTEIDKGNGVSDMNAKDIAFFTKIVKNIPSKLENNHTDVTGIADWSVDMLLPRKGTESSKDHSFYSFVSPENSNICYIYFQHASEITDTLLQAVVGNKGTAAYNAYLKKAQETWTHSNPDNMVIFGNRDIPSETMDEMGRKLQSGNVKCNVHPDGDYVGNGGLNEGRDGYGVAVPVSGKSENIVNIYIDDPSSSKKRGEEEGIKMGEVESEDEVDESKDDKKRKGKKTPWYENPMTWLKILIPLIFISILIAVIYIYAKNNPTSFFGRYLARAAVAVGITNVTTAGIELHTMEKPAAPAAPATPLPAAPVPAANNNAAPADTTPAAPATTTTTPAANNNAAPATTPVPAAPASAPATTTPASTNNNVDKQLGNLITASTSKAEKIGTSTNPAKKIGASTNQAENRDKY